MRGGCFIIRWADDFILGFELRSDANRVMEVLPKRFDRFGLDLHPEKTKLISFSKPSPKRNGQKMPGTFDFLGFTFYWGRTLQGYYVIKKKTARKRLSRFLRMLWNWCKGYRHDPIAVQYRILREKGVVSTFGFCWKENPVNHHQKRMLLQLAEKHENIVLFSLDDKLASKRFVYDDGMNWKTDLKIIGIQFF